jgi:N-acetylglucosamine-6-phosphate deacetylase
MLFANVGLILPDEIIERGWLRAEEGIIADLGGSGVALRDGEEVVDGAGGWLSPGFIDLHVHGAVGRDFMEGTVDAFTEILRHHAGGGTTTLAATSLSAPWPAIQSMVERARSFRNRPTLPRVPGVHLEGPWLSPEKPGAHDASAFSPPDREAVERVLAWRDDLLIVSLAPELPGACGAISALAARGIVASAGHSDAWEEDVARAVDAGLKRTTHLYNAMSSARRRAAYRVGGLLEATLAEPRLSTEIIADGHHVSATLLRAAYRAKRVEGLQLVTDATAACGLPEGTEYRLGEVGCVARGGAGFRADAEVLAGSAARMIDCVRNMVRLAGVPLIEAVRMASQNPAEVIAPRLDGPPIGRLEIGAAADLVMLTPKLGVAGTWRAGERIA